MEAIVKRVGWDEENPIVPIVLLDKQTRASLNVEILDRITVSKNDKAMIAIVHPQFKDLIGQGVTANSVVAKTLSLEVDDTIMLREAPDTPDTPDIRNRLQGLL